MTSRHAYTCFDPLLSRRQADDLVRLCERYGAYGMYSEEPTFAGIGQGLPARWDAVRNFLSTGGRFARSAPIEELAARTNYFRETYAYGDRIDAPGIEPFLNHEGFVEAARSLYGRPVIMPAIVFANLLVPGQELAVHTDVPEFRGVSRKKHPQWLIVVMHHSGLFEPWRIPIATGVAWFHDGNGGEFAFYPDGADRPPHALPVRFNTAVLLDTDSVFHGVDRVGGPAEPVADLRPGMVLRRTAEHAWAVTDGRREVARYPWKDLRFSVSWKAYCFADERERDMWSAHGDDLDLDFVVDRLLRDLRERGIVTDERPADSDLVELLIDTYIHYPPAQAATGGTSRPQT